MGKSAKPPRDSELDDGAALAQIDRKLYAKELASERIPVLSVSPGYRATGLSGQPTPGAGDPAEGAAAIVAVALATESPTGQFIDDAGEVVDW